MIELLIALLFVGAVFMALAMFLSCRNIKKERKWPRAEKPKRTYREVNLPELDEHEKLIS